MPDLARLERKETEVTICQVKGRTKSNDYIVIYTTILFLFYPMAEKITRVKITSKSSLLEKLKIMGYNKINQR